jgi:hypothetical protein
VERQWDSSALKCELFLLEWRIQKPEYEYCRIPLIRIIWDGQQSGYAEIRVTGFFFENRLHWLFSSSTVTIYSTYLRLKPFDYA